MTYDDLTRLALLGTASVSADTVASDAAVAQFLSAIPTEDGLEDQLLRQAGVWAVYRQAGQRAGQVVGMVSEPAPQEHQPACTPRIAELASLMLQRRMSVDVFPELLARLSQAGQRLAPEILPLALNTQDIDLRDALRPVLGQRGPWLAQFQAVWSWAAETARPTQVPQEQISQKQVFQEQISQESASQEQAAGPGFDRQQARTLWETGTPEQRASVLRQLRGIDPAGARDWLKERWSRERAKERLLRCLEVGLSAADEEFLQHVRRHNSGSLQKLARDFLTRLPDSSLARAIARRADEMLWLSRTGDQAQLQITLPESYSSSWEEEGLQATDVIEGFQGPEAWYCWHVSAVPPDHWCQRFGCSAQQLITSLPADTLGRATVVGWLTAARNFPAAGWGVALWEWALQQATPAAGRRRRTDWVADERFLELLEVIAEVDRDRLIGRLLLLELWSRTDAARLRAVLAAIPSPWSAQLSGKVVNNLNDWIARQEFSADDRMHLAILEMAALQIHPDCLDQALEFASMETLNDPTQATFTKAMLNFHQTVQLRRFIHKDIPL